MMKKQLAILVLSSLVPMAALAGGNNFTGPSVGLDVETAKYKLKHSDTKSKATGGVVLRGEQGFDMGNDLVGTIEATAKLNSSKAFKSTGEASVGNIKQKDRYTLGYQQGIRVTDDLMPYAKVEYINSKLKGDDINKRANGVGVGIGAKYAVMDNVEVGAEYTYSHLRAKYNDGDKAKLNGNAVSAGVSYRFK